MKDQLRNAASLCGGERKSEFIRSLRDVSAAVTETCNYFLKRRALVVIKNVWATPAGSSVRSWAAEISKIASCDGSAVVLTTGAVKLVAAFKSRPQLIS